MGSPSKAQKETDAAAKLSNMMISNAEIVVHTSAYKSNQNQMTPPPPARMPPTRRDPMARQRTQINIKLDDLCYLHIGGFVFECREIELTGQPVYIYIYIYVYIRYMYA